MSDMEPYSDLPQPPEAPPLEAPWAASVAPPPPEPWRLRDLLWFALFLVLALPLSAFLSFFGYAALRPLMGWRTPITGLAENTIFSLVLQGVFYVFLLGYVYLLVVIRYRLPFWEGIRWRVPPAQRAWLFFFGGFGLALLVFASSAVLPEKKSFPLEKLFNSPSAAYALAGFAILLAPFMEELFFRGILFSFFEHKAGVWVAIAGTALLFGLFHVPEYWGAWNHALLILLVGLVFSLARGLTGSLVPGVLLHTAYNATLMTGLFIATHHFRNFQTVLGH
jgi:CAAX protease family protein